MPGRNIIQHSLLRLSFVECVRLVANMYASHGASAVCSKLRCERAIMQRLDPCDYRTTTDEPGVFHCSHSQVRAKDGLVIANFCQNCSQRVVVCHNPRTIQPTTEAKPDQVPRLNRQVWNLTQSLAAFAADGFRTVSAEEYEGRLSICDGCSERRGNRCLQCGCFLSKKARGRAFRCPLGKWPESNQT